MWVDLCTLDIWLLLSFNHRINDMPGIFSKIVAGEIPSYKIYEDEDAFAFLDINPKQKGHLLVVPKVEVDRFEEMSDDLYNSVFFAVKKLSKALQKCNWGDRVGVIIEGLDVAHVHVHLIPISKPGDLHTQAKSFSEDEFKSVQKEIIKNID